MLLLLFKSNPVYTAENYHLEQEEQGHIHGIHEECALPNKSADIVSCALRLHPKIKRIQNRMKSSHKLIDQASQVPNPTITTRYVKGNSNGSSTSDLEANLRFNIELGSKRESRIEYAKAQKSEVYATEQELKADILIETVLNMHRLRQVFAEKKLIIQSLNTYNKVIDQLKSLPRLSAEQEAAQTLFEMALEEAKIDESQLLEEEGQLEHYFHISTGHSLEEIKKVLPRPIEKWEKLDRKILKAISPKIKKLESLKSLAQKDLEIQRSNAWPDLKIGPSLAIERDRGPENKMYGFNIQIPIPLFHVNDGARAYARSEIIRAQKNIELTKREEDHERFELLNVYENTINILEKTMKPRVVEKKYKKIEALYLRGVISTSVYLDALKQKYSYLISRNKREYSALKALWNIHKYDGIIFEEKI